MAFNLTQTLINSHLVSGNMKPGNEIALRIDQALLQDVLGTLVMLELEAMRVERVRIDRAVQYVDHNLLETDNLNGDEHLFLRSACRRFGIWYSRAGNGISHPVHMQRFGKPGDTLIGSDSHTADAKGRTHRARRLPATPVSATVTDPTARPARRGSPKWPRHCPPPDRPRSTW
jgi:aconitate hydratase